MITISDRSSLIAQTRDLSVTAPSTERADRTERIPQLDSLRGLAALSVLASHHLLIFPLFFRDTSSKDLLVNVLKYSPFHIVYSGHEAVLLFFILSGFVLSLPYLSEQGGPKYGAYLTKRFCRIYIPYAATIALAIACCALTPKNPIAGASPLLGTIWMEPLNAKAIMNHAMLIGTFDTNKLDPVIWSLVHEARVSLIFPLLILLTKRLGPWFALAVSYVIGIVGYSLDASVQHNNAFNYFLTLGYLPLFQLGITAALYRKQIAEFYSHVGIVGKTCSLATAIFLYSYPWIGFRASSIHSLMINDMVVGLGAVGFVAFAISSTSTRTILMKPALRGLGLISYSLFLLHPIILTVVMRTAGSSGGMLPWVIPSVLMSIAIAVVGYFGLEKPSIALGRKLTSKPRQTPKTMVETAVRFSEGV